jgi:hypothetical protein
MRITKKIDPLQRMEHIRAAGELEWDVNQGKIMNAGANKLLDRDRKIYLAGWTQGAAWAHKIAADDLEKLPSPWKASEKYAHLKPFPAQADRGREFPDGSVETCYQVMLSFLDMIEEALSMPELERRELAANKAICSFLRADFKRALNAIEATEQVLGAESEEIAG